MPIVTPRVLIARQLDTLTARLPGVLDGDVDAVHEARVATRRLREVLPLMDGHERTTLALLRSAGRHLGRVRELDVMRGLLDALIDRAPAGAGAAARAKHALRDSQQAARRAMVKALEELDLDALRPRAAASGPFAWAGRSLHAIRPPKWPRPLRERIASRAEAAAEAVERATGVYMPRRAHGARIAIKKLRYAVEVASETGLVHVKRAGKDLRRVQDALGKVHDAQVLHDRIEALAGDGASAIELAVLKSVLADDIARAHADYVRRRERLLTLVDRCRAACAAHRAHWPVRPVIAASAVAVPLLLLRRRAG